MLMVRQSSVIMKGYRMGWKQESPAEVALKMSPPSVKGSS